MQDFKKKREGIVISILAEGRGIMSISKLFGGDIGGVFNNKTTEALLQYNVIVGSFSIQMAGIPLGYLPKRCIV